MTVPMSIVYFAYLGDEGADADTVRRRLTFMERQLGWLSELIGGAAAPVDVLVPYVAPRWSDDDVRRSVERHGFRVDPASIAADRRNTFEYRGFVAMKAMAQTAAPGALIYYCHSKGIVHLEEHKMGLFRFHTETGLTADLTTLIERPGLTRATLFPYRFGWCWYNFFWIKAGYMAGLTVEESADRYQFEALVGDRGDREGYRGVLPLIDRVPFEQTGIAAQPWYRPLDTTTPTLAQTYDRYAGLKTPTRSMRHGC
jgi:hypothetical protein